jgi:hypothetical protein
MDRVLKITEENIALQKSLAAAARGQASTAASTSHAASKGKVVAGKDSRTRKEGVRGTKRGREDVGLIQKMNIALLQLSRMTHAR